MKNKKVLIVSIAAVILIVLGVFINKILNQTRFNSPNDTGNTAGNLMNNGLFCEYDGKIYFSNAYDNNYLYVMNSDMTNPKLLKKDSAKSINVCGKYIYYTKSGEISGEQYSFLNLNSYSLCRTDLNGNNKIILDRSPSMNATLSGNYIYYHHYDTENATTLYKVKIDGEELSMVNKTPYATSGVLGNTIYYPINDESARVMAYNTENGSATEVYEGNCYYCLVHENYLYFLDVNDNFKLARVYLPTGKKQHLTNERVDLYNLYDNVIFYQTSSGDNSALWRMNSDGSNKERIMNGTFTGINVTSNYTYFSKFTKDTYQSTPVFMVPTFGSTDVTEFAIK